MTALELYNQNRLCIRRLKLQIARDTVTYYKNKLLLAMMKERLSGGLK